MTDVDTKTRPLPGTTHEPRGTAGHRFGRWCAQVGWRHLVGIVVVVICVLPLLYVFSASLNPSGTLTGSSKLFSDVSLENYSGLFDKGFGTWARNSIVICVFTAVGTVLMGAAAAYAFSRYRFSGRRATLTSLLIVQMFPQMLAVVAIFLLLINLKDVFPILGTNSIPGLICVYLGGALGVNTFLLYGFFNTVPRELDEAARIDGASHAQIFWTIIMPLVTPILVVVGLLSFISTYGEFVIAKTVLTSSNHWTLAIGLYQWGSDQRNAPWGLFAAGAVLAAVPIIVLFLFLQKYIVSGLTSGSVKG